MDQRVNNERRARDRQHSKHEATQAEYREREQLISQAKAEYARNNSGAPPSSSSQWPWTMRHALTIGR